MTIELATENTSESIVGLGHEDMSKIKENPLDYLQSKLLNTNKQITALENEKDYFIKVLEQPNLNDEQIADQKIKIDENEASLKYLKNLRKELERQIEAEEKK